MDFGDIVGVGFHARPTMDTGNIAPLFYTDHPGTSCHPSQEGNFGNARWVVMAHGGCPLFHTYPVTQQGRLRATPSACGRGITEMCGVMYWIPGTM